jgi:hypothetical protein
MTNRPSEAKTSTGWLQRFVENNIAVLVCGAAVIWSGFNSTDAVTAEKLAAQNERIARIEHAVERLIERPLCAGATP